MTPLANAINVLMTSCSLDVYDMAEILNDDEYEIQHWLDGDSGPNPTRLRGMYDLAMRSGFAIAEFNKVLDMSARDAVGNRPWGGCLPPFGRTLRHYMVTDLHQTLIDSVRTLEPSEQERFVFDACQKIRDMRDKKNLSGNT